MSFGDNIKFLRKRENMTQEDFAGRMEVSRQTVSKWESGASYPETDKIIRICDMFACSIDMLMRGSVKDAVMSDTEEYDRHYNRYTAAVERACMIISAGLTLMVMLLGFGLREIIGALMFMAFVAAAVIVLIISDISHSEYLKKHPDIKPFYCSEEIERFNRKYPFLIAIPTALVILGVAWLIGCKALHRPVGLNKTHWDLIITTPMLFLVTAAIPVYVYAGMQKSKYNAV